MIIAIRVICFIVFIALFWLSFSIERDTMAAKVVLFGMALCVLSVMFTCDLEGVA